MTSASSRNTPDSGTGGPVGKGDYVVKPGDCISSIAFEHGLFWETVWNHCDNQELKDVRKHPNLLLPGDKVTVPSLRKKEEPAQTDQTHRFRVKGVPERLRLVFKIESEPRKNELYRLSIDKGVFKEGTLDADGLLDAPIPPNAKEAHVIVGEDYKETEYVFQLGHVDPISEQSGIWARLANLGYPCEGKTPRAEDLPSALRRFQEDRGLDVSGEFNDATMDALKKAHGD